MEVFPEVLTDCLIFSNKTTDDFHFGQQKKIRLYLVFACFALILLPGLLLKKALENEKAANFLLLAICLVLSPLVLGMVFVLIAYRSVVYLLLQKKLGEDFGGLVEGTDAVWMMEDPSKGIINVLMIIQYDLKPEEFYTTIRSAVYEKCFARPNHLVKLQSIYRKAFGYYYLIKNQVTLDDCFSPLKMMPGKVEINQDDLLRIVGEYTGEPLPKNHTGFWQVLVGQQVVNWRSGDFAKSYPVVFRIHHSLADGVSLVRFLMGIFADPTSPDLSPPGVDLGRKFVKPKNIFRGILAAPLVISQQVLKTDDCSMLHGPLLSGQKILVAKVETSQCAIGTIKRVKNKFSAVTFSDVLLTVISKSLREFFKKHVSDIPKSLSVVIPTYPTTNANRSLIEPSLNNKFSVAMLNLPLTSTLTDTLNKVRKETGILRSSHDYQVNYWLLSNVSSLLPELLLKPLLRATQCTLVVSNLPGPGPLMVFGGHRLEDVVFWVPHRGSTGVSVSIFSYDGRLQIGVSVDKVLVSEEKDVQGLVEGIYRNLELLDLETDIF